MLKYYRRIFRWWWLTWDLKFAREMADLMDQADAWMKKLEKLEKNQ